MTSSFLIFLPAPTHQARRRCASKKIPNRGNHDVLCLACQGGGGVRQRPPREGTIAPWARSRAQVRRHHGAAAMTNGIAEPRRAAMLALAACALRFF